MTFPVRSLLSTLFACSLMSVPAMFCFGQQISALPASKLEQPNMPTVLYGAAYYSEYEPTERLDDDIRMMKAAGFNVVRMGESTWSLWEPEDGRFEYAWMDKVVDAMNKAGIKVILGTPTYSIPTWLYHEHPEVMAQTLQGGSTGYGMRQTYDQTSPAYRFYAGRVIRHLVEHYKNNPNVIGWQIDNETGSSGAINHDVFTGFVQHLKDKFGTTDALNRAWLLNYWGQDVNGWENMPTRDRAQSTGYKLEWTRWEQAEVSDFLWWQADLVRQYRRQDQFVMHDFSGGLHRDVNEYQVGRSLDIIGVNVYHGTQEDFNGERQSFIGDYYRSLHRNNYLVTETNAQAIGWDSSEQFPPYDEQARLDVYSDLASGANMVEYWHWATLHSGQETYWKGVLGHDREPNRVYEEISKTGAELKRIGPALVNLKIRNEVAILYSADSANALDFMPLARASRGSGNIGDDSRSADYTALVEQLHRVLYKENVGVDFIVPEQANFGDYKIVLVPALYIADEALLKKLSEYVKSGGQVIMTFKSGFANENSMVRSVRAPGPLREAAGISYQEFSSLKIPIGLAGDPFHAGDANKVSYWAEMLLPEHATVLARYDDPFLSKWAAITDNSFGRGFFIYEGTWPSDEIQAQVVRIALKRAGLIGVDQTLPTAVRVKHGQNDNSKRIHYLMNFSGSKVTFPYRYGPGTDLLSGAPLAPSATIELKPWDLIIAEEASTTPAKER